MAIQVGLYHSTYYKYDRLIQLEPQTIRLKPAPHNRTPVLSYSLKIEPEGHFLNWQQDPFGNYLARAVFPNKVKELKVQVDLVAEIHIFNPFDFFLEKEAEQFPFQYEPSLGKELKPYLEIDEHGPLLKKILKTTQCNRKPTIDFLIEINQRLTQEISYKIRLEPGVQTCEQTLELRSGSCRDIAWLLCQMLRHFGLATRFTSGYLIQLKPDQKALDGPSGTDHDFTDLHAWTEVYLPGAGWIGLDPTSGLIAGEGHIPLCSAPRPMSAAPISGMMEKCESTLEHNMSVIRLHEDKRVTKPYTDSEWGDINELAAHIETSLEKQDVRLTEGGEPTFVSIDDRQSSEWQLEALGPTKKMRAYDLLWRLKKQFASGGCVMDSHGKWYPGEMLPRWSLNCYWRKDNQPIWEKEAVFALAKSNKKYPEKPINTESAKVFLQELAKALGVSLEAILPAQEDAPYYLWKEQSLPIEGDILKANLYEKAERKRLQQLLQQELNAPVGYVLPIHYSYSRKTWTTNLWKFRHQTLLLTIGDSPIGLRLPLNRLPNCEQTGQDNFPERNSVDQVLPLPSRDEFLQKVKSRFDHFDTQDHSYISKDPCGLVNTALCAETRDDKLHVFLPPLVHVEHFLELIAAIEWTAEKLQTPVVLEGYPPPSDLRIQNFKVTPDPGVIEVNMQPAKSWKELSEITETIYEEAKLSRLTTEKFLLDGRKVGTGGGNHLIMGGETPADSPFLRRPDLLKSFLSFWQNHPSLSYLFSSLFIGPTSQHPRIDEARHESLYELEIAFNQVPYKKEIPLWQVDRLFRNLLVDLTGNTHRSEFCIDKLFSPDGDAGRLGLVEIRCFEMPPHPQMSLLQNLLVRACVSLFWKRPYTRKLVRWGTRLHDQFMLPHFIWSDLQEVLHELKDCGYPFKLEWFLPLFEFRFPKCGSIQIGNGQIELRTALEPWPVMGEEGVTGTVSRAVDSSVERIQIKAKGFNEEQTLIVCNGQRVPLQPTNDPTTKVAGIRFKAWAPPSGLHPTIPVQAPLIVDAVDLRYQRSVGGCMYHVTHPGGRNYDTIPVNENEAEGRRLSRFQAAGHTPGKVKIPPLKLNEDFPHTLDLRKYI